MFRGYDGCESVLGNQGFPIARLHATEGFIVVMFPKGPRPFSSQESSGVVELDPRLSCRDVFVLTQNLRRRRKKLEMLEEGSCYVMRDDVRQHETKSLRAPDCISGRCLAQQLPWVITVILT